MYPPPQGAEAFYVAIFAIAVVWWFISMARTYGWLPWKWPWGVWFRRRQ
jgi:hypothetical protein